MSEIKLCKIYSCDSEALENGYCASHQQQAERVSSAQEPSRWFPAFAVASGVIAIIGVVAGCYQYSISSEVNEELALVSGLTTASYSLAAAMLVLGVGKIISLLESRK